MEAADNNFKIAKHAVVRSQEVGKVELDKYGNNGHSPSE